MKVLIYKRTHTGDPDNRGIFGIHNCMGTVRGRKYDAVIGLGGKKPWENNKGIAYKINWIGVGRQPPYSAKDKKPQVSFSYFCLMDEHGPLVKDAAPNLYNFMYCEPKSSHRRVVMFDISKSYSNENEKIQKIINEIDLILNQAKNGGYCIDQLTANKSDDKVSTSLMAPKKCYR